MAPIRVNEARREAYQVIHAARRWIKDYMPGFRRHVKLDNWTAVQLWKQGRKATIFRHSVGETIRVKQNSGSYFGSAGGWGVYTVYGPCTDNIVREDASGFVVTSYHEVTFDKGPAAVFTASGDDINGGRVFWRELHIAE